MKEGEKEIEPTKEKEVKDNEEMIGVKTCVEFFEKYFLKKNDFLEKNCQSKHLKDKKTEKKYLNQQIILK